MARRDIVVVGASAGGVEALVELAAGLPADLAAAVFVVLHLPIDSRSYLPRILSRAGPLRAVHAEDGAPIVPGLIHVAPPNHHLVFEDGRLRLTVGPRINGVRPSVDVLFRSAARTFGERVVGVVLSGTLQDGVLGLDAIKLRGGVAVVQDPDDAQFPSMPRNVLEGTSVDYCEPVARIPELLSRLTEERVDVPSQDTVVAMTDAPANDLNDVIASGRDQPAASQKRHDEATGPSCPNCHGSVWEVQDGTHTRIECRVGHAFSVEAFLGEQASAMEDAVWSAVNALQERATALRRFAASHSSRYTAGDYLSRAQEIEAQARLLRDGLMRVIQAETNQAESA